MNSHAPSVVRTSFSALVRSSSSAAFQRRFPLFVRPEPESGRHPAIPRLAVKPAHLERKQEEAKKIEAETITPLERISLVDFSSVEGVQRLEEAVAFVQPLKNVDVNNVEPLYTPLEDQPLRSVYCCLLLRITTTSP